MKPSTPRSSLALLALAALLTACADEPEPGELVEETTTLEGAEGELLEVARELPSQLRLGEEVEYRLRVRNVSDREVTGVVLRDRPPAGFQLLDAVVERGEQVDEDADEDSPRGRAVEASAPRSAEVEEDGAALVLRVGTLAPGEEAVAVVTGSAQQEGEAEACLTVTYDSPVCSTWVVVNPELALELAVADQALWICEELPLLLRLENRGTGTAAGGVVRARLPEGLRTAEGAAELVYEYEPLEAGEQREERVPLRAERAGEFQVQALAERDGMELRSRTLVLNVVEPRLELEVEDAGELALGSTRELAVVVSNTGKVPLEDVQLELESGGNVAAGLSRADAEDEPDEEDLELGRVEPGAQRRVVLAVAPEGSAGEFELRLVATARCLEGERAVSRLVRGSVVGVPALRIEVVDERDPVRVGETTTYTIAVDNQGSKAAAAIALSLRLPPELELVEADGATDVTPEGERLRFGELSSLAPGDVAEWRVQVRALSPGQVTTSLEMRSSVNAQPVVEEEPTTIVE